MRTSYVVDGYNLLFHLGLFDRRGGTHALENARECLLDYLRSAFGDDAATVIFDSGRSTKGSPSAGQHQGLHVQFAGRGQEADDVIEELIANSASPQNLVVISNDHRIQVAARRKGAVHVVERLAAEGLLAETWSKRDAIDLVWTLTSIRNWEDLVVECGWSNARYEKRLRQALSAIIVAPGSGRRKKRSPSK